MPGGEDAGPIHPVPTRNGLRYLFHKKHHGQGWSGASVWSPDVSADEEFAVFDTADALEMKDERGWLFGVRCRDGSGRIPNLGTAGQTLAEFPLAREREPWHGYPLWPLGPEAPGNRRGEAARPSRAVFNGLVEKSLITPRESKRLQKGDHL